MVLAGCQSHGGGERDRDLTSKSAEWQKNPQASAEKPKDIWERIRNGYQLQDQIGTNPRIERQRFGFASRPASIQQIAERSSPYIHYIVERLEENGMPLELALLPMIESSYNPMAYSPAQAAGLWQFVPSTARDYNLRQTNWYDGRRDITASTKAAISYLKRLHDMFNGDWLLALAAYNAGEGTVSRAIERNQNQGLPTDYWNLPLPRETQDYVPKLLAVSQIVQTPASYGVALTPIANEPYFEKVAIRHQLDLSRVAAMADVDKNELQQLNPAFKQGITLDGPRHLLVPVAKAGGLSESLARLQPESLVPSRSYRVRRGESLSEIARRHGVAPRTLRELNQLPDKHVEPGQSLLIPHLPGSAPQDDDNQPTLTASRDKAKTSERSYRVRKGDTLWSVAKRLDVPPADLQRWNNLKRNELHAGQVLTLRDTSPRVARNDNGSRDKGRSQKAGRDARQSVTYYKVRNGDSLAAIARRFSVAPHHLKSWNPSLDTAPKPGQTLTLYLEQL
jgi:membrane-bound lytic murein transglycosylase D